MNGVDLKGRNISVREDTGPKPREGADGGAPLA